MNIIVRQETEQDYELAEDIVERAFRNEEFSDHTEHILISRLRKSDAFIPELCLVAEIEGHPVGHIMLTRLSIVNDKRTYDSLALAPVSVLPEHQRIGIGGMMIKESIKIAKKLGHKSVIVLGHGNYYPKFGFMPASRWGIKPPFDVPDESFMALELEDYALTGTQGIVVYGEEFLIQQMNEV
ncbi:MAG TPA: GNAT family N-acetyltransferase [Clostridiales bacterium]|nr:GNAT family N-acetyltransferase [Clostridiales bacterium]